MPQLISAPVFYTAIFAPAGQIGNARNFQFCPNLPTGKDNTKWKMKWPHPIDRSSRDYVFLLFFFFLFLTHKL